MVNESEGIGRRLSDQNFPDISGTIPDPTGEEEVVFLLLRVLIEVWLSRRSFSFRPNWSETQLPSNQVAKGPGSGNDFELIGFTISPL
jgi:hypothetical protein